MQYKCTVMLCLLPRNQVLFKWCHQVGDFYVHFLAKEKEGAPQ